MYTYVQIEYLFWHVHIKDKYVKVLGEFICDLPIQGLLISAS